MKKTIVTIVALIGVLSIGSFAQARMKTSCIEEVASCYCDVYSEETERRESECVGLERSCRVAIAKDHAFRRDTFNSQLDEAIETMCEAFPGCHYSFANCYTDNPERHEELINEVRNYLENRNWPSRKTSRPSS